MNTLAAKLLINAYSLAQMSGCKGDAMSAAHALASLNGSTVKAEIEKEASRCTFERRRYGRQFYCWAHHPEYGSLGDPWPGTNWPKASLLVAVAQAAHNFSTKPD